MKKVTIFAGLLGFFLFVGGLLFPYPFVEEKLNLSVDMIESIETTGMAVLIVAVILLSIGIITTIKSKGYKLWLGFTLSLMAPLGWLIALFLHDKQSSQEVHVATSTHKFLWVSLIILGICCVVSFSARPHQITAKDRSKNYFEKGIIAFRNKECDKAIPFLSKYIEIETSGRKLVDMEFDEISHAFPDLLPGEIKANDGSHVYTTGTYSFVLALFGRAACYTESKQYDRAIEDMSLLVKGLENITSNPFPSGGPNSIRKLAGDCSNAFTLRGRLYFLNNNHTKAESDFNKAILINPHNIQAIIGRGRNFAIQNKREEAIDDFSVARELEPTNSEAKDLLILVCRSYIKNSVVEMHFDLVPRCMKILADLDSTVKPEPVSPEIKKQIDTENALESSRRMGQ